MWICEVYYAAQMIRFTIGYLCVCVCYSWEMATKVDLDASFDNVEEWKGIQEKSRKS
jgi:hypothetical protein